VMKKILSFLIIVFLVAAFFLYGMEYSRKIPDNLTVFVLNTSEFPKEFYSSPHAYKLIKQGEPIAKMTYLDAKQMNIPMAEDSKDDFSCFHNAISWWLIDNGLWWNSCRWTSDGKWQ
jgi:hypothetical protein